MAADGPIRRVFGVKTPDPETRQAALDEEGPSWSEWFYFDFAKVWVLLAFLVAIALVIASFADPFNAPLMALSLALVAYGELLLYRLLWYRPDPEKEYRVQNFRPTWLRPARFGRWTPEAWRAKDGKSPFGEAPVGPDPREFL